MELDALKFAFEILIVGALALPWIEVLYRTFRPASPIPRFDLTFIPGEAAKIVTIAVVVGIGYLLGSAISRFSVDFFNDELWGRFPTEDHIRDSVYYPEYCISSSFEYEFWSRPMHLAPVKGFCPKLGNPSTRSAAGPGSGAASAAQPASAQPASDNERRIHGKSEVDDSTKCFAPAQPDDSGTPGTPVKTVSVPCTYEELFAQNPDEAKGFEGRVEEVFRLQESELLLQGMNRIDRLKQYFDQITILRGAALNAVILFVLAFFGIFGRLKEFWKKRMARLVGALPSVALLVYTIYSLWNHWFKPSNAIYSDPPLAEATLLILSFIGLCMAFKREHNLPYFQICIIAFFAMVISFGGWWWTEVTYDRQVIHSLSQIKNGTIGAPVSDQTPEPEADPVKSK